MFALQEETPVFCQDASTMTNLLREFGSKEDTPWELITSAAPFDKRLPGDCPHCHRVLMILLAKSIPFKLIVVEPPTLCGLEWVDALMTHHQPPILRHDRATVLIGADDISEFIEMVCSEPSLTPTDYDVLDVGFDLFGDFFRYLKNRRPEHEDALREKVQQHIEDINAQLVRSGGPYLDGERLTLADCNLWPKLHHVLVSLAQNKSFQVPDSCVMVLSYIGTMMETDASDRTRYPEDWILHRWRKYTTLTAPRTPV